jgi:hypothetical protein
MCKGISVYVASSFKGIQYGILALFAVFGGINDTEDAPAFIKTA